MRNRRLKYNAITALVYNFITIMCGFILPKFILETYGSDVNGLVNSVSKFLGFISFFELGIGAVVQSGLYQPLANEDYNQVSRIIASGNKFFRRLAKILIVYIAVLLVIYPLIIGSIFSFLYTDILIVAVSINLFAQYYFGRVNQILITADQKGYIFLIIEAIVMIVNTVVSILLMKAGISIQFVKISTSLIFLIKPGYLYFYVRKNYKIDRTIKLRDEPLQQKRNGVAQHIAIYVLDGTDAMVLTFFSTLTNVSIYYVYSLVVNGVKAVALALTSGMQSLLGELVAKKEEEVLLNTFAWYEWISHSIVILIFGCCQVLLVPFVKIYTSGVNDANYVFPLFGFLITVSTMLYCLSLPYNNMILACNAYKETQNYFIIAALINVIISILLVNMYGLIGVAIGTLISILYQSIWMVVYNSRNMIKWSLKKTIKQYIVDAIVFITGYLVSPIIVRPVMDYLSWMLMAFEVAIVYIFIWMVVNLLLYRKHLGYLIKKLR